VPETVKDYKEERRRVMNGHKILSGLGRSQGDDTATLGRRGSVMSRKRSVRAIPQDVDGFEFDPLRDKSRIKQTAEYSFRSGSSTANGSDLAIHPSDDADDHERKERLKEVGQLASVFLEVRKGIMNNKNIDVAHNQQIEFEREPMQGPHIRTISKSTTRRAEKVKAMLNLYYFSVFQAQKSMTPKYEGVDGVYNPLQIIRNRRIRKKHHEQPQIATKTITLPSQAFSEHKHKIVWQVDLDELTQDIGWRSHHWHELVNPQGALWFPAAHNGNKHNPLHPNEDDESIISEQEELSNMHDRLFQEEEVMRDISVSSREDFLDVPTRSRRKRLARRIRKRSKSPFKRLHSTGDLLDRARSDVPSEDFTVSEIPSAQSEIPTASRTSNIFTDVQIEPIKSFPGGPLRPLNTNDSVISASTPLESSEASADLDFEDWKLTNLYLYKLRKLINLVEFGSHGNMVKREEYKSKINYDGLFSDCEAIESSIRKLRDQDLVHYENILKEKMDKISAVHEDLTSDFSTRVDRLLLLSDRTIGEVNTTLSLEVRKLSERFGKLGPLHRRTDTLVSFSYWLLENLVVVFLWTIWIGFSIGRVLKFFFLLTWGLLEWIFS
jgi:hypothetical protein